MVAKPGSGTAADREKALRQRVMDDPRCRAIMERLGAQLERVIPLDDPPSNAS